MAASTSQSFARLLWELSARQHGVVTHEQLMAHGLSPAAIKHRIATGRLHPVARGVYAVGRPQLSREGRWLAAVLSCGPHAVLSHASAAALWGIRPQAAGARSEVSVPYGGDRSRPGVRVHRVKLAPEDVRVRDGIPVASPALTLVNQAAQLTARRLEADVNAADIHGLITPDRLRAQLRRYRRRPGIALLRQVLGEHSFTLTRSELERMFLPLARQAGMPEPQTQRRVDGFTVDFFWPDLGLVVETDGLRYHRTPTQQARDLVREQTHRAAGIEPLRFTHRQVAYERPWVTRTLRLVTRRLRS